jgi:hypothetical protein
MMLNANASPSAAAVTGMAMTKWPINRGMETQIEIIRRRLVCTITNGPQGCFFRSPLAFRFRQSIFNNIDSACCVFVVVVLSVVLFQYYDQPNIELNWLGTLPTFPAERGKKVGV